VNTLNGTELGGRRIAVREDREDRDVKQFVEGEEGAAAAPRPRSTRGRGRGRGRGPRAPIEGEPSGFQVGLGVASYNKLGLASCNKLDLVE
jgi:hypothetical protein